MTDGDTIRILVVDDHPVVRDGLVMMLETQPDFVVTGAVDDGTTALRLIESTPVDVILLDLDMPGMDGVEVLTHLRERDPEARALVFTAFDTDERIVGAVEAGARGYLLKGAPRNELFNAIRVVHGGGSLLQPVVASKLMAHLTRRDDKALAEPLTEREMDALELLAKGMTNKEIARALFITERTVKFHISSILGKLGAGNRTEAVTIAAQKGLVQLGE